MKLEESVLSRREREIVRRLAAAFIALVSLGCATGSATESGAHGKAFWQAIVKNNYEPPTGSSAAELAPELGDMLASPDPELRDELGYSILASWIFQKRLLGQDALRVLLKQWSDNLKVQIGGTDSDAVFRRSFSALALSVLVARDNADPFLDETEFRALLNSALEYIKGERDLRGYDFQRGWIHATAHTADLLKFLGRSRFLKTSDQAAILNAFSDKLEKASIVFIAGEDERMARSVLSLVMRKDFDVEGFRNWTTRSKPAQPQSARPEPSALRAYQNLKNFFAKLEVLLLSPGSESPATSAAADSVRSSLKGAF